ncbi:MAG: tetratricopeptide repeat protein [Verrucomicrobia bacterium]|nr:tetratricopeptide repeat protein [Deltaproteobacteria bacterium]
MKSVLENHRQSIDMLMLVILVAVLYGRGIGHDFQSNFDDNWYILYNDAAMGFSWQHLKEAFTSFYLGHYAPLQIVSYMLDYSLWGLAPGGFHLTNIVLHAVNGLLIYRLFWRWQGDRLFALFGAAIFLLHPVQVETVAWISQRKSLLSMLFFLLAWEGYLRHREADPGRGKLAYSTSLVAFALSLLAKSMTVVFPLLLIAYDRWFCLDNNRFRLKDKIPFFLAAGLFAGLTIYAQTPEVGAGGRAGYHGGSPWATMLTMLPVFCRYLGMLVWPAALSAEYAPPIHHTVDATVLAAALLLVCVTLLAVRVYRVDRRSAFWIFFFWIGLLPVSQIVPMIFLMYDHYLYLPMMGVAALCGAAAVWLRKRLGQDCRVLLCLLALPLLALSVVSSQRLPVWQNPLTLWGDAVAKEPASGKAWGNYGEILMLSGQVDAARRAYERGTALDPSNTQILDGLGNLYTSSGELDKGLAVFHKLLEIKPYYVTGWAGLGTNHLKRGDYLEAEKAYKHALDLQPEAWQVIMLQGNLALIQRRLDLARDYYHRVEAKNADYAESAYRLACVEALAGRRDEALAWLEKALQRGYGDYDRLHADELSALWQEPQFNYLLTRFFP